MRSLLQNLARRGASAIARQMVKQESWSELLVLQGTQAAMQVRQMDRLAALGDAEFKVFSQWGEDGIIEWLVSRLAGIPESFVEFGVEDYSEANTRFLLCHRNWRGLVIDGAPENIACLQQRQNYWRHNLSAVASFITRDNIDSLIAGAGFAGDIGLLSIDIDGNDYWVWEAVTAVKPWIVIVEYNAVLGDIRPLSIPYQADFRRMGAHHSALYYGASVPAFEHLAARLGYTLAGSNRAGNNLFYVRNDVGTGLIASITDRRPRPSLYAEARDRAGDLALTYGIARRALIDALPVTDIISGQTAALSQMGDLYSPHWTAIQQGMTPSETR